MVDAITWAASATETDVDMTVEEHFRAYRIPEVRSRAWWSPSARAARLRHRAGAALRPEAAATRACSQAKGLPCLNMANGAEANHTPDERVSGAALETMLAVAVAHGRARRRVTGRC